MYLSVSHLSIVILSILFLSGYYITLINKRELNILKIILSSTMGYICQYLLISSCLLYFDLFKVEYSILIIFAINLLLIIFKLDKIKVNCSYIDFNIKKILPILFIILLFIPFILLKSETIVPSYDAGVYGSQAIDLMYGNDTKTLKKIDEYELVNEKTREDLLKIQNQNVGLYHKYTTSDEYRFEYHGTPTWPSLMSLSGKIFGVENISSVLSILYILSIISIYYIVEELNKNNTINKYVSVILFAFSPLTIYLAKISLSELLFTSVFLYAILLLIDKNNKIQLCSSIPFGVLGFIHFSTFLYIPIIYVILLILGVIKGNRTYGYINLISIIFYGLSLIFINKVATLYVGIQYEGMFGKNPGNGVMLVIFGACILIVLFVQIYFNHILIKNTSKILDIIKHLFYKYSLPFLKILAIFLALITIYKGYLLGFTDTYAVGSAGWIFRENYANKGLSSLLYLNIVSILMATSFISVPLITYSLFNKKYKWNTTQILFCMAFLYSLSIYTILRTDTSYNYYASRYFFVFLIPCVFILVGLLNKSKKMAVIICTVCITFGLPFNILLLNSKEFSGNMELFTDVSKIVGEDTIVMLNEEDVAINRLIANNLKQKNNSMIFNSSSIDGIINLFPEEDIYLVSRTKINGKIFDKVFEHTYKIYGEITNFNVCYPLRHYYDIRDIYIYKIVEENYTINMNDNEKLLINGFHNIEKSGIDSFAWSSEISEFEVEIMDDFNRLKIMYLAIPDYVFSRMNGLDVSFSLDNFIIYETTITVDNNPGYIEFDVPKELLINKDNKYKITMKNDIWIPHEFNLTNGDNRKLGIPVSKIEVLSK